MRLRPANKKYVRLWKVVSIFIEVLIKAEESYGHDIEHDRVDQSSHTHSNGPTGDAESIALGSQITGEDLSGNQESNRAPGGSITTVTLAYIRGVSIHDDLPQIE